MALPNIMRRLFRSDGYGPLLKPEIIPFASGLASNAADAAASTEWVKDLVVAPVYVDPNGSDSNDGLSSAAAVQTFNKAIEIGASLNQGTVRIIVAAGSYSQPDGISIEHLNCIFYLQGNVTITSSNQSALNIKQGSNVVISGNYTLTLIGYYVSLYLEHSTLSCYSAIKSICNTAFDGLSFSDSSAKFYSRIDVAGSNIRTGIYILNSNVRFLSDVTVNVSDEDQSTVDGRMLEVLFSSALFDGNVYIHSNSYKTTTIDIYNGSKVIFWGNLTTEHAKSSGYVITCINESVLTINGLWWVSGAGGECAIRSTDVSKAIVLGGITAYGHYSNAFAYCTGAAGLSILGTVTNHASGRRFSVQLGGQIYTNNAGQNYLPGNSSGYVGTNSYGYYY